ncbi:glycosyltransferase [Desulfolucanica intricata]|uniref:glycosyltransferase n=1 Tax=Desulfolucanica intricata TaxID=1285191 RepID=UPI00083083C8|nr:glycosyltransferase [Desulfolucanica intricata]
MKVISIIIPSRNEGAMLQKTVDSFLKTKSHFFTEIIIVNDGSTDSSTTFLQSQKYKLENLRLFNTGGIGLARAKNLGASRALGDILVFSDAHIKVKPDWLDIIIKSFDIPKLDAVTPGIGSFDPGSSTGYGQNWDADLQIQWLPQPQDISPVPLAPGGFTAIKKVVFNNVGGFDPDFRSFGFEDVELSLRLWLFGYRIYTNPFVRVKHLFRKELPYHVPPIDYFYNFLRMAFSHFNLKRINKSIKLIRNCVNFERVISELVLSDVREQRKKYLKRRKHSDDWFMDKFNIPF